MSSQCREEIMREAVLTGKGKFEIMDRPVPVPGPGEVLLRIHYCGICGSDVHLFEQGRPDPLTLGHEFSGSVAETGPDVDGWRCGETVAVRPSAPCGVCPWCCRGYPQLCERSLPPHGYGTGKAPGAYAEYMALDASSLYRLPPGIAVRDGAFAEPVAVVIHAIRVSRFRPGDSVLVLGCGTIGLITVNLLSRFGAGPILAADPVESKRTKALTMGANMACDPCDLSRGFLDETIGPTTPDIVFECVGIPQTLANAFDLAPKRGRVLVLGVCMESASLLPKTWILKELEILATFGVGRQFESAMRLLGSGGISPSEFITREIPLARIQETMENLARPNEEGKVMVRLV